MRSKTQFNVRLPEDLLDWLDQFSKENGISKTEVVEDLLQACRSGRLSIRPPGPDPFPVESHPTGSHPSCPALLSWKDL